ncbi:glycosyltransferase involved in cell wall biosynthesis [Hymenobacter luteus]|uniref:Glycosyltransferase involved in cell wall biosynthesis n=2 Tax=Hymenobacter TaxID=89966 RepID=A0A7W9WB60_9BACT|nr:glycosyltransferase [Hymenobacter luteus]MBB6059484.1 glycosyltransferase involved in cell wall biosynthesis [Hymenobacter luteus]
MPPSLTILLASVLKPLDDTRMLGKFGHTLARRPGTTVHVAGRLAPTPPALPDHLHTHALLDGSRLSLARLRAQWRYWQLLRRLQPQVVVVHAPELLPLTVLWQLRGLGRRFAYDVRENYALNIRTQQVYPAWARGLLANLVRGLEALAARRAWAVLLAERSYAEELPFAWPAKTLVMENKYQPNAAEAAPAVFPRRLPTPAEPLNLLYSGTISELNGVWEAIRFTQHLRAAWPGVHLTIIGACQQPGLLPRLQAAVAAAGGAVTLRGGAGLVPHAEVVAEMRRSHLGLLPYRPHTSTARCVPTKLFEYLAHGLPMVVPPNPLWQALVQEHGAGLVLDFQEPAYPAAPALSAALSQPAYYPRGIPAEAFWDSEAEKLHHLMDSIR